MRDFPAEVTEGIAGYDKLTQERQKLVGMIVNNLDRGLSLWHRNWTVEGAPVSAVTGRAYRGVNNLYLTLVAMNRGYTDNRWATFNQIKQNGWSFKYGHGGETIAKGRGVTIEFFEFRDRATKEPFDTHLLDGMSAPEKEAYIAKNVYPLRRAYTVFNADLLSGLPERNRMILPDNEKIPRIENLLDYWDKNESRIIYGGDEAYYNKAKDEIHIPDRSQFVTYPEFYSTSLHELSHSTGHVSRLDRDFCGFGTPEYAMEELRAELASMFLSQDFGVHMTDKNISNNSAYLKNWVAGIRENPDALFKAIADAERISRYVHVKENEAALYISPDETLETAAKSKDKDAGIYMPPSRLVAEERKPHIPVSDLSFNSDNAKANAEALANQIPASGALATQNTNAGATATQITESGAAPGKEKDSRPAGRKRSSGAKDSSEKNSSKEKAGKDGKSKSGDSRRSSKAADKTAADKTAADNDATCNEDKARPGITMPVVGAPGESASGDIAYERDPLKQMADIAVFEKAAHTRSGERFIALYNGRDVFRNPEKNRKALSDRLAVFSHDPEQIVRIIKSSGQYDKSLPENYYLDMAKKSVEEVLKENKMGVISSRPKPEKNAIEKTNEDKFTDWGKDYGEGLRDWIRWRDNL